MSSEQDSSPAIDDSSTGTFVQGVEGASELTQCNDGTASSLA